jgi:hypothetical protein
MKTSNSLIRSPILKYLIALFLLVFFLSGCSPPVDSFEPTALPATSSPTAEIESVSTSEELGFTETSVSEIETIDLTEEPSDTIPLSSSTASVTPSVENQSVPPASSATITVTPSKTRVPSRTPYPTLTRRPTRTPSITSTPKPPLAYFRINNLGAYSKVVSPIIPESIISPGQNGRIYIDLIGEDGREISKEVINYYNYIGQHFGIAPEIEFEIEAVAETGRLQVSSVDRYNRTMWLASVDLILLQIGHNQIAPPQDFTEPYIIRSPEEDDTIQGGMLQVRGAARILNKNPLLFECIDQEGNLIASGEVTIHASSEGISHIPFEAYLPYQVTSATNVRLSVRQESDNRLPGTISLSSIEITLSP